jgi:hypothetical protein
MPSRIARKIDGDSGLPVFAVLDDDVGANLFHLKPFVLRREIDRIRADVNGQPASIGEVKDDPLRRMTFKAPC